MGELEEKAKAFATAAHERVNQKRKYTNEPYITHPAAVVELVHSVPHTEEMLAAAWLHDVVEDTGVAPMGIQNEFGAQVAMYVGYLTDPSLPPHVRGNREIRKAATLIQLMGAPAEAQTIKLADLIDNSSTIMQYDPHFAVVYLREKAMLLRVLTLGDKTLQEKAAAIIRDAQRDA